MKKMLSVFLVSMFVLMFQFAAGSMAIAQDQCDVAGHTYYVEIEGIGYALSFVEKAPEVSPAPLCGGTAIFSEANGPYTKYDWSVRWDGLKVAGFPCVLSGSELTLYGVPPGMYELRLGNKVYLTNNAIPFIIFEE